ncbi:MAG: dienelactone hydrolase family protein [Gammaproteobacteria bacterium]
MADASVDGVASPTPSVPLDALSEWGFTGRLFPSGDITHTVFEKGAGKPVLVMHELPGLAMPAVNFGLRLSDAGFNVHLPHLFGEILKHDTRGNYRKLCISREFGRLQAGVSSPITMWLRALVDEIAARTGRERIGAIGMCLTGAFAIPLVLNPRVRAAIAAEPAIPFSLSYEIAGIGRGEWMRQLNVSDAELAQSAQRAKSDSVPMLGMRFRADRLCPAERLARMHEAYGEQLQVEEYSFPSRVREIFDPPHAVLTEEYDKAPDAPAAHPAKQAFSLVVDFLNRHL